MSESIKSDSTNSDSFELINNNDQNNDKILISPSLSSTSTENINLTGNTTDNEEFRMEQEFNDKLDLSNISNIVENDGDNLSSSNSEILNIQTNKTKDFDNDKLQQQLNMQIESNQQHLQQFNPQLNQQQQNLKQFNLQVNQNQIQNNLQNFGSQLLQQQLSAQQLNELNTKLQQQQDNQIQQQDNQLKQQLNQQSNQTSIPPNQSNQQLTNQESPKQTSPIKEVVKLSPLSNFDPSSFLASSFGWLSNNDLINQVKENAVDSFNKVLITLDPQMKEILLAGGPNILLISNQPLTNEDINSIRDGFIDVFKKATVKSIETVSSIETAAQLVGFKTAVRINKERISALRSNIRLVVCLENFLYNFEERWFSSECIMLDDPLNKIELSVHTQGTPISNKLIDQLKSKSTSYKFKEDGFNSRLDNLIATELNCSIGDVHKEYVGFDKSVLYHQAVVLLSNLYRNKLKKLNRLNHDA